MREALRELCLSNGAISEAEREQRRFVLKILRGRNAQMRDEAALHQRQQHRAGRARIRRTVAVALSLRRLSQTYRQSLNLCVFDCPLIAWIAVWVCALSGCMQN